jgi:DNA-binding transcriptional LysR family regulator
MKGRVFMDLKQIEYIVKIAETGNITRAAEQLFVTQSALNQQLLKLENQLGIKLFYRHKHDLTPTDAGKVYLKYGRQMLLEKKEAYNIINDLAQYNLGHLSFAFSRERGLDMFVSTFPRFHEKFPGITVEPQEMRVFRQQQQIAQGYVDLGLVTLTEKQKTPELIYDHIRYEPLLLVVPRSVPFAVNAAPAGTCLEDLPYLSLDAIRDFPFVMIFKDSTMRSIIDKLFDTARVHPYILFESGSFRALIRIVESGMACTITSAGYYNASDDVAYFRIPGDPIWELSMAHKKDTYISKAMKYYMELIRNYFNTEASLPMKNRL